MTSFIGVRVEHDVGLISTITGFEPEPRLDLAKSETRGSESNHFIHTFKFSSDFKKSDFSFKIARFLHLLIMLVFLLVVLLFVLLVVVMVLALGLLLLAVLVLLMVVLMVVLSVVVMVMMVLVVLLLLLHLVLGLIY